MKYFLDTEFHEYKKNPLFSKGINTIELISIGIIAEDGREYYAISKDFDLKKAWNNEWLKENVLRNIWKELYEKERYAREYHWNLIDFSYKGLKNLIRWNGKSNKQIRDEIFLFVNPCSGENTLNNKNWNDHLNKYKIIATENLPIQFYGYYSDYDWVVFCWLFDRMKDLPKGFPMYCIDLKQILDEKANLFTRNDFFTAMDFNCEGLPELTLLEKVEHLKKHVRYPSQTNEHNALADAKWNFELYKFLQTL